MDTASVMLGWSTIGLQVVGFWSLLVARFGHGSRLTTSAQAVFMICLLGLGVCWACCGAREWSSGLTAGATFGLLLLGMSFDQGGYAPVSTHPSRG